MLVVVSSYSLVTTIPRLIAVGMNHINNATSVTFDDYWFYMWGALIIAPWNYCGNFFMYVLSGKEFREELALMFCCRERPSGAFHSLLRYMRQHKSKKIQVHNKSMQKHRTAK